jgi:60 kDa SS-A/Ro ribonucleoprotein
MQPFCAAYFLSASVSRIFSQGIFMDSRLERFLTLGSESGAYCVAGRPLTLQDAPSLVTALREDGLRTIEMIAGVSQSRRAPNNDPALFALAVASSPKFASAAGNAAALALLPKVARTGPDLCVFVSHVENFRGWGRALRNAVAAWYLSRSADDLACQFVTDEVTNGWTHRDLLRLAHPTPSSDQHSVVFRWAVGGAPVAIDQLPGRLHAVEKVKSAGNRYDVIRLIENHGLTHEMIPGGWKDSPDVWEALLEHMSYATMINSLGKLTQVGVIGPGSLHTGLVAARIVDRGRIARSGIHPVELVSARAEYAGGSRWTPVAGIVDALDEAFPLSFGNVKAMDRRICVALDASPSMAHSMCAGSPHLSAAMASLAMAKVLAAREPGAIVASFDADPSLPFTDARKRGLLADAFLLFTGNHAWAEKQHPARALEAYRAATGIPAKLVVVAMPAAWSSVCDPDDPLQLDIAGFDATVPGVIRRFVTDETSAA